MKGTPEAPLEMDPPQIAFFGPRNVLFSIVKPGPPQRAPEVAPMTTHNPLIIHKLVCFKRQLEEDFLTVLIFLSFAQKGQNPALKR